MVRFWIKNCKWKAKFICEVILNDSWFHNMLTNRGTSFAEEVFLHKADYYIPHARTDVEPFRKLGGFLNQFQILVYRSGPTCDGSRDWSQFELPHLFHDRQMAKSKMLTNLPLHAMKDFLTNWLCDERYADTVYEVSSLSSHAMKDLEPKKRRDKHITENH